MNADNHVFSYDVHVTTKNSGVVKDLTINEVNTLLQEQITVQTKALELLGWIVEVDVISHR